MIVTRTVPLSILSAWSLKSYLSIFTEGADTTVLRFSISKYGSLDMIFTYPVLVT